MTRNMDSSAALRIGAALGLVLATTLFASVASAHHGDCGQPLSAGLKPATSDALVVLKVAVGTGTCGDNQDDCECDVDSSGRVTPSDALVVLRSAVGFSADLQCEPTCGVTTTTLEGATTTTLEGQPGGSTTTTLQGDDGQGDDGQGDDNQGEDDQGDLLGNLLGN